MPKTASRVHEGLMDLRAAILAEWEGSAVADCGLLFL